MAATEKKYREALRLYASTDMTAKQICEETGVSLTGFRRYVRTYHRELLLQRNHIPSDRYDAFATRLRRKGTGQTLAGHRKYREAIEACYNVRYIEYNVSQIAKEFHLDPSALGAQLRYHYCDIQHSREKERMRRGLNDNLHRGVRRSSVEQYAAAVEMLRETDQTIRQVADACGVSYPGLRVHLAQYHKDVVALRAERRDAARNSRKAGALNGSGVVNRPRADKVEEFRAGVELYRTTLLPLSEIAVRTNVSLSGLTHHLYRWHRNLVLERKGIRPDGENEFMDLSRTSHCLRSTRLKYADAIRRLKNGRGVSVAEVAAECGLDAENLRRYLQRHEPELARRFGRKKTSDGKNVLARSSEKYEEAIRLYRTTPEPLKSIAQRLGLVYQSLSGFVRRNAPDAIAQHNALFRKSTENIFVH